MSGLLLDLLQKSISYSAPAAVLGGGDAAWATVRMAIGFFIMSGLLLDL
jgi:hypothetical protein